MKVLVTGGSKGIGFAIANLFIAKGHSVYLPDRTELDLLLPINLLIELSFYIMSFYFSIILEKLVYFKFNMPF